MSEALRYFFGRARVHLRQHTSANIPGTAVGTAAYITQHSRLTCPRRGHSTAVGIIPVAAFWTRAWSIQ